MVILNSFKILTIIYDIAFAISAGEYGGIDKMKFNDCLSSNLVHLICLDQILLYSVFLDILLVHELF